MQQILASPDASTDAARAALIQHVDRIVTTINPAVLPGGSNVDEAPSPKTNPHICNRPYTEVEDFVQDLADLIATCQRHTRCSAAYCLRTRNGQQKCRFGYPKPLQPETVLVTEDEEPVLLTARNDGLINSFNPVQLSAWRANVDMQSRTPSPPSLDWDTLSPPPMESRMPTPPPLDYHTPQPSSDGISSSHSSSPRLGHSQPRFGSRGTPLGPFYVSLTFSTASLR